MPASFNRSEGVSHCQIASSASASFEGVTDRRRVAFVPFGSGTLSRRFAASNFGAAPGSSRISTVNGAACGHSAPPG